MISPLVVVGYKSHSKQTHIMFVVNQFNYIPSTSPLHPIVTDNCVYKPQDASISRGVLYSFPFYHQKMLGVVPTLLQLYPS